MKLCLAFLLFVAFVSTSLAAPYFESNDDDAVEPTSGIEEFTFGDLSIDDDEESDQEVFTLEYLEGDDDDEDTADDDTDDDSKTELEALTLGDLEDDGEEIENYGIGSAIRLLPKIIKAAKRAGKIIKGVDHGVKAANAIKDHHKGKKGKK